MKKISKLRNIEFLNDTTDNGGYRARELGYENVILLNFANRRNVGGGYMRGACAQEEDLCRCFPTLHRSLGESSGGYPFGLSDVIVTQETQCMRNSDDHYVMLDDEEKESFYFVSAAAPNVRYGRDIFDNETEQLAFKNILLAPLKKFNLTNPKKNAIVLGAWGCGAFGNQPEKMASLMKLVLQTYGGNYGKVIFAIPSIKNKVNYDTFKKILMR